MSTRDKDVPEVVVQVVPLTGGRQIAWGSNKVEDLTSRLEDLKAAIASGGRAVADSLPAVPTASGWQVKEVSGTFGITLTAEAGVILSKVGAEAAFEVSITFERSSQPKGDGSQ